MDRCYNLKKKGKNYCIYTFIFMIINETIIKKHILQFYFILFSYRVS